MGPMFQASGNPPVYPQYIQDAHHNLLSGGPDATYQYNVLSYMESAISAGSPYARAELYDPNGDLDIALGHIDSFENSVSDVGVAAYSQYLEDAVTALGATLEDSTHIDAAVEAFETKDAAALNTSLNSYCGAAFETRSTQNSQFAIGAALLYAESQSRVAEFRANLELQKEARRDAVIVQAASEMLRARLARVDIDKGITSQRIDHSLRRIVANREWYADALSLAEHDSTYELELFRYGENMLHALSGVATLPARLPKGASALAGMMSMAPGAVSAGLALGAVNPALGIVGGLAMLGLAGGAGYAGGY